MVYKYYCRQATNIGFLLSSLQCGQVLTQTEFYNHYPTCRAGSVVQSLCDEHGIRGSTFYKWLLQYSTNGQFKRDARGLWADNFLDHNEDVKAKLTDWLRCLKEIDVDSLAFISEQGMIEAIGRKDDAPNRGHCLACFNGSYPTPTYSTGEL